MNERLGESLSALMDSEANELEIERVLSAAGADDALRATWLRYNLARQSLQSDEIPHARLDISGRVRAALDEKVAGPAHSSVTLKERLRRPLTSLAVAASVAATVVIGGQQLAQVGGTAPYEPQDNVAITGSPVGLMGNATAVPASYGSRSLPVLRPATRTAYAELAQQRANRFMQEHAEQAALNSPQGLVPFSRVREIRK